MPSWWLACGDQHQHTGSGSTLEALHGVLFYVFVCVQVVKDKSSLQQTPESSELGAKLEKVEELERQIEDQKFKISQLREEKVRRKTFVSVYYLRLNWLSLPRTPPTPLPSLGHI